MKNEKVNISGLVLAATGAVITLFASQVYCASFHAIWPSTGAPNGTLKVQVVRNARGDGLAGLRA